MSEVLRLFRTAGYAVLTPLQKKLIPLIISGRDVVVQAEPGAGKTAAFLLPLMMESRSEPGVRTAIIAADADRVRRIAQEHLRFSRLMRDPPPLLTLGDTDDTRREERRLERAPSLIAATAGRVIDHIRRGTLQLDKLSVVVVQQPEGDLAEDFVKDVQFIFAKLPSRRQTVLFTPGPIAPSEEEGLLPLLRRPAVLSSGEPAGPVEHLSFEVGDAEKPELLARIFLARRVSSAVVLHSPRTRGGDLARRLNECLIPAAAPDHGAGATGRKKLFTSFARGELEVLCLPHPLPVESEILRARCILYYDLPLRGTAPAAPRLPGFHGSIMAMVDRSQARELAKIQEIHGVIMRNESLPGGAETIRGSLERIMRRIREEENLEDLARLRSLIRKQVPLLMRSYVTAYLLKSQLPRMGAEAAAAPPEQKERQRAEPRGRQKPERAAERAAGRGADRGAADKGGAGEGKLIQLFVSIGRNRRVFPRDLSGLFLEKLKLRADEIGSVRVFDKYSFVEIARARAEEAISRLSGSDFKGKTITVNFAKKKEEKESS